LFNEGFALDSDGSAFETEGLFAVLRAVSAHPKNPLQEKLNRTLKPNP